MVMSLYFDAGALEVWVCEISGSMKFFGANQTNLRASKLCPDFPEQIEFP